MRLKIALLVDFALVCIVVLVTLSYIHAQSGGARNEERSKERYENVRYEMQHPDWEVEKRHR
jgi:hypothetical protein